MDYAHAQAYFSNAFHVILYTSLTCASISTQRLSLQRLQFMHRSSSYKSTSQTAIRRKPVYIIQRNLKVISGNNDRRSNYATGGPVVLLTSFDNNLGMNTYHTLEIRPLIHLAVPEVVVSYSRALASKPFDYGSHQCICILCKMQQTFKFID